MDQRSRASPSWISAVSTAESISGNLENRIPHGIYPLSFHMWPVRPFNYSTGHRISAMVWSRLSVWNRPCKSDRSKPASEQMPVDCRNARRWLSRHINHFQCRSTVNHGCNSLALFKWHIRIKYPCSLDRENEAHGTCGGGTRSVIKLYCTFTVSVHV